MTTSVVTGGAGFLGSHLCDRLLAEGHRVICVDNLDTGSLENIEHIRDDALRVPQPRHHRAPRAWPSRVDYVFHLACPASPIDYLRLPLHTLKVGSYGTHNALGPGQVQAGPVPARLDLGGLRRPAGAPPDRDYWGHVNPIGPRGVYDEAKRYAEALTMAYHRQQGVDTHIVRIFNTYGPRMRPNDGRAVPPSSARP